MFVVLLFWSSWIFVILGLNLLCYLGFTLFNKFLLLIKTCILDYRILYIAILNYEFFLLNPSAI